MNFSAQQTAAQDLNTDPELLRQLARSAAPTIRAAVAADPGSPIS